jgi:hypothetical protein
MRTGLRVGLVVASSAAIVTVGASAYALGAPPADAVAQSQDIDAVVVGAWTPVAFDSNVVAGSAASVALTTRDVHADGAGEQTATPASGEPPASATTPTPLPEPPVGPGASNGNGNGNPGNGNPGNGHGNGNPSNGNGNSGNGNSGNGNGNPGNGNGNSGHGNSGNGNGNSGHGNPGDS